MVHLVSYDQLIGRVAVEHPEELRNVGKKDLTGSHKNCYVAVDIDLCRGVTMRRRIACYVVLFSFLICAGIWLLWDRHKSTGDGSEAEAFRGHDRAGGY